MQDLLIEHGETVLLFSLLSALSLWMARSLGYFKLINGGSATLPKISFAQVASVFGIYLGTLVLLGSGVAKTLHLFFSTVLSKEAVQSPTYAPFLSSFVQIIAIGLAAFFLYLYCKAQKDRASMLCIWKDRSSNSSIASDIAIGITSWAVSFPLVTLVGQVFDFFVLLFITSTEFEQVAVNYLKMSLSSSILFVIALFTVIIAAPILEELLFRGFLLNFFKRHLGRMAAIVLSSVAFALFHFSLSQDIGNISLIASLFTLALFLGYIYERQRSLFASIALHMTFNTISVIRIISSP